MADTITNKQLLKNLFETGDAPTQQNFADLITSAVTCVTGTFTKDDIDAVGILSIAYGNTTVNIAGVDTTVAISITKPRSVDIIPPSGETIVGLPVTRVSDNACTVNIGSSLIAGTYTYYLNYNE